MSASTANAASLRTLRISVYWLLVPIFACLAVIPASIAYIAADYEGAAAWYRNLNPYFYRNASWQDAFFTPSVFSKGKIVAGAAIAVATACSLYFRRAVTARRHWHFNFMWSKADTWSVLILWGFQSLAWSWGMLHAVPAYDEAFSAMNCAMMHPFQCASYYMLPNNHVLFNLLNVPFAGIGNDPVLSARIISGIFGLTLTPFLYRWIKSYTRRSLTAVAMVAVLLLQFPVWAFGFQGRGYMLYTLCTWVAFISAQHYFRYRDRNVLPIHVIATVAGFWTLPSYLYWEFAICIYALGVAVRDKQFDLPFIRSGILAAALVFLAYSPVLCFSGLGSITENQYVSGDKMPVAEYLPKLVEEIDSGIRYAFSWELEGSSYIYLLAFLVPVGLATLLRRAKLFSALGFAWISWFALVAFVLVSQRFPFHRSLIAHVSLLLAVALLSVDALLRRLPGVFQRTRNPVFPALSLGVGIYFCLFNAEKINYNIYFYPADARYNSIQAAVNRLPRGAVTGFSDESFYWKYLCRKRGLASSDRPETHATHYVYIPGQEPLPEALKGRSHQLERVDEYVVLEIDPAATIDPGIKKGHP